jgi:hypothetical protein
MMPSSYTKYLPFNPIEDGESPRSSRFTTELVLVTYKTEQAARLTLAHWEMADGGYSWYQHQDTVNHCHISLQSLREGYESAKSRSQGSLAAFVLEMLNMLPKIEDCQVALTNDLSLARLHYQKLCETPFEQQKIALDKELVAWQERTASAITAWNEEAVKLNKKYPGPLKGGKWHQKAADDFATACEKALKPYDDEHKALEKRVNALKAKIMDSKLIPEVILKTEQEIGSHERIIQFINSICGKLNQIFPEEKNEDSQKKKHDYSRDCLSPEEYEQYLNMKQDLERNEPTEPVTSNGKDKEEIN